MPYLSKFIHSLPAGGTMQPMRPMPLTGPDAPPPDSLPGPPDLVPPDHPQAPDVHRSPIDPEPPPPPMVEPPADERPLVSAPADR